MGTKNTRETREEILRLEPANYNKRVDAKMHQFMLYAAQPSEEVEARSTRQSGTIKRIIRNRKGVPVCFEIITDDGNTDYISVDRVSYWAGITIIEEETEAA